MLTKPIVATFIASLTLYFVACSVSAQSVTALYRVDKVQHLVKQVDDKCVESKENRCAKIPLWRVFYRAVSKDIPLQTHQVTLEDNPPQIGSVMQLTIDD